MSKTQNQKWNIRGQDGKIRGPLSREGIIQLISQGGIVGDEEMALQPNGDWHPIVSDSELYDLILKVMEEKPAFGDEEVGADKMEAQTVINTQIKKRSISRETGEKTQVGNSTQITDFSDTFLGQIAKISGRKPKPKPDNLLEETRPHGVPQDQLKKELNQPLVVSTSKPVVNAPTLQKKYPRLEKILGHGGSSYSDRFSFNRIILAAMVVAILIYIFVDLSLFDNLSTREKIRLLAPANNSSQSNNGVELVEQLQKVKFNFEMGNPSNWLEAQEDLVKLAEQFPQNTEVRELLCLTHKELWPYAFQDSEDLQVLNFMAQSTRSINPAERHGRTCELVKSWLVGKFESARSQLENLLQDYPNVTFFIWLKAEILLLSNDFINGQGFAGTLNSIWPRFTKGFILAAQLNGKAGRYQESRQALAQALKVNPDLKQALLMLGDLDFRHFQQDENAQEILMQGLNSKEIGSSELVGLAYMDLALLAERHGDLSKAKIFAEKGLQANPSNENLRTLVTKFGGSIQSGGGIARTQELVALGDQYLRSGDCLAAQAQYRAAFDLNSHYPAAAVKAAQCLYKINQVFRAYDYLKKAIKNNPDYFPAYTLLADYYSQKFDFTSAMAVLNQARTYSSEAYEIYKGYALVELRKNNFGGAVGYISRAIGIYGVDAESYVILSKAQIGVGKSKEAFQTAQRALELDPVSVDVKVAYGEAISALQGEAVGLEYFARTMSENKFVIDYKLAYASTLKKLERFAESLPIYQEVTSLDPKNKKAQIGMGEALNAVGRTDEALNNYLLAATLDPTDPEPLFKAGILYLDTGSYDPAIKQFQRVLSVNPYYPLAHYYIGKAAFLNGNLNGALEEIRFEKTNNPGLVEPYLLAADVYWIKQNYAQCTNEYQQATKISALGADLYVKLARCHRMLGALDVAQSMLDIAAEKESGYPDTYREQGELMKERGDAPASLKAFEKYLGLAPNAPDKKRIESLMKELSSR